jgi:hypothetical protein
MCRCEHQSPAVDQGNDCDSYHRLFTDSHAKPDLNDMYLVEYGGLHIENLGTFSIGLKLRPFELPCTAASDMQAPQDWEVYESLIDC